MTEQLKIHNRYYVEHCYPLNNCSVYWPQAYKANGTTQMSGYFPYHLSLGHIQLLKEWN